MGLNHVLDEVVKENKAAVQQWLENKPGSWGALAGKAVVAVSRHEGRSLNDAEKRAVWQMMWDKLMAMRQRSS